MIKSITLKNWKSHLNSKFEFSLGTNALVGILGSGKTSVLDGICFALFGTFPTLQSKKIKLDDIIMKKPIEKDKAEVELVFEANGKEYSVKRVIEKRKGTTYSEIRENGKILESPSSSLVTRIVEQILKVNYELFAKAIYSEQNALDYFLTIPRGKRMKKIDELLMIDKFEKARSNTVTLINKLLDRKEGIELTIEQINIEKLKQDIEEAKKDLEKIKESKEKFRDSLAKLREEKKLLEKEVEEIRKITELLENEINEEKNLEAVLNEHIKNLSNLEKIVKELDRSKIEKSLKDLEKNKKNLEKILEERQKVYEKKQKEVSEYKARIDFIKREKIEKIERELKDKVRIKEEYDSLVKSFGKNLEKELEAKKKVLTKIVAEFERVRAKIENLEEMLEQLSSVEGKCPVCERRLTAKKREVLIKQRKKQIGALKTSLAKLKKEKKLSEEEMEKLEEAAKRMNDLLQEIKDFDGMKRELENSKTAFVELSQKAIGIDNEIAKIHHQIEEIMAEIKLTEERKQELSLSLYKFEDYEATKKRIEELIKQREEKVRHITEIKEKLRGRNLEEKESLLRELSEKAVKIETEVLGLEKLEQEKKLRLSEFEKSFETFLKTQNEIKRIENIVKELRIFERALKETQIGLREEFVIAVNYSMSKLWQTLYPYRDFIDIRLAVEGGDYILQLKERSGKWVNVEGVASGGERSIAALALRIAFALVLAPQLKWLVLDEPTHNLDSKAVEDLAVTLRERIGEFIDQVFLITHNEKLEEAVTGNLYRLERNKEMDGVTKVTKLQ
jgi:exonuclease SbcC